LLIWHDVPSRLSDDEVKRLMLEAHVLQFAAIVMAGLIAAIGVFALAIRLSRLGVKNYLGLIWPEKFYVKVGFAGLAALYVVFPALNYFFWPRADDEIVKMFNHALTSGTLVELVILVVIVAPLVEEFMVRGFLLRGWAASRLGPAFAIVLTALVWT